MEISELGRSIKELEDSYPKISDYEFVYVYDGECNSLWKGKRSNLSVETILFVSLWLIMVPMTQLVKLTAQN